MDHSAGNTIKAMVAWDYTRVDFMELKYEDLIRDTQLMLFHEAFTFLGFPGSAVPHLLSIAYGNSLFSGQVASDHVRSGKARQWPALLKTSNRRKFLDQFGDVLIQLGYEEDDRWVDP
jgi:hypothetical protein